MKEPATKQASLQAEHQGAPTISRRLMAVMVAVTIPAVQASDNTTDGSQWNVMVVPSRETVYSGQARQIFDQQCAKCHSKDGRAQTPIARQRHVQDLSESRLPDAMIVEQLLEGTHNKANTFKMPPFKEKLSRAEVESLVPLVKAFRPVLRNESKQAAGNPRLAGMINCFYGQVAVLETFASSGEYFILREQESHAGVTLLKLKPKQGMVKLDVGGTNPIVTLILSGWAASHPRGSGRAGFLGRLSVGLNRAPPRIVLSKVNTDLVLFLYSQFSGRTLIRSPRLPVSTFDLDIRASGPDDTVRSLNRLLRAKGITTIEDGAKFLLVVPTSEVPPVKPRSSEIKLLAADKDPPALFPAGVIINFSNTELSQVLKLYTDVTGRTLDQTQRLFRSNATVSFTTQTPITAEECAYALETLLGWHSLKLVPADGLGFKSNPILGAPQ